MKKLTSQAGISAIWIVIVVFLAVAMSVGALFCYSHFKELKEEQARLNNVKTELADREKLLMQRIDQVVKPYGYPKEEGGLPRDKAKQFRDSNRKTAIETLLRPRDTKEGREMQLDDHVKKQDNSALYGTVQDLLLLSVYRLIYEKEQYEFWVAQKAIGEDRLKAAQGIRQGFSQKKIDYRGQIETEIQKVQKLIQDEDALHSQRKTQMEDEIRVIDEKRETEPRSHERVKLRLSNQVKELHRQFQELLRAQEKVDYVVSEAHGHLLSPDTPNKTAFIDIGTRHRVVEGMRFLIAKHGDKGRFIYKGEIEVKEALLGSSRVEITKVFDKNMPLVDGDLIVNPFFNRYRPVVVAFAGNKKPVALKFSFDDAERRIVEYGSQVSKNDKGEALIDSRVDFLIYTELEPGKADFPDAYQKAVELGIPIGDAADLYKFLGD